MKPHPIADLFPMFGELELDNLAADIRDNGLKEAITTFEGKILDGRNRFAACLVAKVEPRMKEYSGKDPLGFVLSKNLHRRHLSTKERAEIAAKIATMKRGGNQRNKASNEALLSQQAAAEALKVSRSSVQRAANKLRSSKAKSKEARRGWTKEELEKDPELSEHFLMIESVYGKENTDAIRNGTIPMQRADVLYLGRLPKQRMQAIEDLIFTTNWSPARCLEFLNTEPDMDSTVEDLMHLCLASKVKYWSGRFNRAFIVTIKWIRSN